MNGIHIENEIKYITNKHGSSIFTQKLLSYANAFLGLWASFLLFTDFFNIAYSGLQVFSAMFFGIVLFSFVFTVKGKAMLVLLPVAGVFYLTFGIYTDDFLDGLAVIGNRFMKTIGNFTEYNVSKYVDKVDAVTVVFVFSLFLISMAICFFTVYRPNFICEFLVTMPVLALGLYYYLTPNWFALICLVMHWIITLTMEVAGYHSFSTRGTASFARRGNSFFVKSNFKFNVVARTALTTALSAALILTMTLSFMESTNYERSDKVKLTRRNLINAAEQFDWDDIGGSLQRFALALQGKSITGVPKGLSHNGKMGTNGEISYEGIDVMSVISSEILQPIYLKGWVGAVYENNTWSELPKDVYNNNADLFTQLAEGNATPQYLYDRYAQDVVAEGEYTPRQYTSYKYGQIHISMLTEKNKTSYMPYFPTNTLYEENKPVYDTLISSPSKDDYFSTFYNYDKTFENRFISSQSIKEFIIYQTYIENFKEGDFIIEHFDNYYQAPEKIQKSLDYLGYPGVYCGFWAVYLKDGVEGYYHQNDVDYFGDGYPIDPELQYTSFLLEDVEEYTNLNIDYETGELFYEVAGRQELKDDVQAYTEFVKENYLQLPDPKIVEELEEFSGITEYMEEYIAENYKNNRTTGEPLISEDDGSYIQYALIKIKRTIQDNAQYTLNAGETPEGEDFVTYFLTENHLGSCSYYASAGVILARMVGIPARYCEGYVAVPDDYDNGTKFTDENYSDMREFNLKDSRAHAWAEIYIEGQGWVPYEFTEGYDTNQVWAENPPDDEKNPPVTSDVTFRTTNTNRNTATTTTPVTTDPSNTNPTAPTNVTTKPIETDKDGNVIANTTPSNKNKPRKGGFNLGITTGDMIAILAIFFTVAIPLAFIVIRRKRMIAIRRKVPKDPNISALKSYSYLLAVLRFFGFNRGNTPYLEFAGDVEKLFRYKLPENFNMSRENVNVNEYKTADKTADKINSTQLTPNLEDLFPPIENINVFEIQRREIEESMRESLLEKGVDIEEIKAKQKAEINAKYKIKGLNHTITTPKTPENGKTALSTSENGIKTSPNSPTTKTNPLNSITTAIHSQTPKTPELKPYFENGEFSKATVTALQATLDDPLGERVSQADAEALRNLARNLPDKLKEHLTKIQQIELWTLGLI